MTRDGGNMSVKEDHSMCCMCFLYQRKDEGEKSNSMTLLIVNQRFGKKVCFPFTCTMWVDGPLTDTATVAPPRFGETDMHLRQFHDRNKEQLHPFLDLPYCWCICVHLVAITF